MSKNKYIDRLSEHLKSLVQEKGLSTQEIANKTAMLRTNVEAILEGKINPSIDDLTRFAFVLDMDLRVRFVPKGNYIPEKQSEVYQIAQEVVKAEKDFTALQEKLSRVSSELTNLNYKTHDISDRLARALDD